MYENRTIKSVEIAVEGRRGDRESDGESESN
jgi:hypothetical protein